MFCVLGNHARALARTVVTSGLFRSPFGPLRRNAIHGYFVRTWLRELMDILTIRSSIFCRRRYVPRLHLSPMARGTVARKIPRCPFGPSTVNPHRRRFTFPCPNVPTTTTLLASVAFSPDGPRPLAQRIGCRAPLAPRAEYTMNCLARAPKHRRTSVVVDGGIRTRRICA